MAITEAHFDTYFNISVRGTLFTMQKMLPLHGKRSAIVVTGSITASKGAPAFGVYSATRAALRAFVRSWASELNGWNTRVNLYAPAVVDWQPHALIS